MAKCEHLSFASTVNVYRLTDNAGDVFAFNAEVKVRCTDCGRKFQFMGLEAGVNMRGAVVSVDGLEARLAICPQGENPSPLDRMIMAAGQAPERPN